MSIADMFSGMDSAPTMGAGQYFSGEGDYVLKSKAIRYNDGHKGPTFIAEFEVVSSNNDKHPVGCTRSYVVLLNPGDKGKRNRAFGDIKLLIFALALNIDPKNAGQAEQNPALHAEAADLVRIACDSEYAKLKGGSAADLEGLYVKLTTFEKPTQPTPQRPTGGVFTKHVWEPAAAQN